MASVLDLFLHFFWSDSSLSPFNLTLAFSFTISLALSFDSIGNQETGPERGDDIYL